MGDGRDDWDRFCEFQAELEEDEWNPSLMGERAAKPRSAVKRSRTEPDEKGKERQYSMAFVDVSLDEVESSFKPHKNGLAHLRIEETEMRPNKKQTGYYMNTRIKVLSIGNEPPVDDEGKPNEAPVWHMFSLQPQALFGLANLCKAMGLKYKLAWDPEKAEDRNRVEMELKELLTGKEFVDILKTEVYHPDDGSDDRIKSVLSGKYKAA